MLKNLLVFATVALALAACAPRVGTPAVDILARDGQGLLTVAATGFGIRQYKTEQDARRLVLERLMYTGIADASITDARLPLVADASKLSAAQKRAIENLMAPPASDRYFQSVAKSDYRPEWSENLRKSQNFVLKVNYDLLRRDLESQSVIRKFGL